MTNDHRGPARLPQRIVVGLLLALMPLLAMALPVGADEEPPPAPPAAAPEETDPAIAAVAPTVAVVQGRNVNLRVGPRIDVAPVLRMNDGTVLLVVERLPGWLGVRVPEGFPAAVAARFVSPVGADAVRIEARELNLRRAPPEPDRPMPDAFRDHAPRGTVVPVLERVGDWVRIWAPESIRAYVSVDYVKELGPLEEHTALVEAARERRRAHLHALAKERRDAAAQKSGAALREAFGAAQQTLYKLRVARGIERTPVIEAINALEVQLEACREAPVPVRKLARAVRQDLEAELELRMARKDAEVARLRGLVPPAEKPPAPKIAEVEARGTIRWEPAPRWRNGGEWVLWMGAEPRYVLHVTTGLPHPLPDLKGNADDAERTIRGAQSGERVFGLPVIELRSIAR